MQKPNNGLKERTASSITLHDRGYGQELASPENGYIKVHVLPSNVVVPQTSLLNHYWKITTAPVNFGSLSI